MPLDLEPIEELDLEPIEETQPQGFGDLKVAERDNEKTARRNALLEEQKRARFDTSFGNENLRALETGEQLLKGLTTPVSSAIHGIRQATGLEDPNNPLEIVPQMQGLKTEEVQRALPHAMPGVPQTIAGLSQAGAGIGNFLLSPDTIGLGGVGGAGKAIQAAAGSVFSGDMAAHMPEQAERLGTATVEGKGDDIVREGALTTLGALGAVAPIAHASLPKSTKAVEEKFKVERPGESEWSKVPEELKTERKDVFDEIKPEEIKAEEAPQIPAEPQRAPDLLESRAIESGKPEDAKRFAEIDEQMKGRTDFDSPEFQSLFAEREAIKNRNGGMPPLSEPGVLTEKPLENKVQAVPEPIAETITGRDEKEVSEMPAERPGRPKSAKNQIERPWDLIDEFESNVGGKLSLSKSKKLIEHFQPIGRLRKLFTSKGGYAPDDAAQAVNFPGSDVEFLEALIVAAQKRKGFRTQVSSENKAELIKEKQLIQFQSKVLKGEFPKKDQPNIERVPVSNLVKGDLFEVQGNKFEVKDLEIDDDGNLLSIEVKDGPKFGVQRFPPDLTEYIHVDKGTFKPVSTDFVPKQSNIPKLRSMEKQGDLLSNQTEDLSLVGEKGIDFERVQREKEASEKQREEARTENDKRQTLIGMGGAVESEFKPVGQTATSIKNAAVDSERQKRGLPPAIEPARRSFGTVWDEAMATVDRDPGFQDRLIDDIRENPRALTDLEDALLLHRQIDLQNEHAKATRDLAQAYEDGRQHAVELEMARVNELNDKLKDIYDIGKRVGTETGRGLNARKMLANEDFSLASLSLQKQAAVGGRKLTPAETVEIQKIADEYKAKNEALEKALADKDQRLADLAAQQAYEQMKRETQPSAYVIQVAEKIVAGLEQRAKKAEKDLQAIFARTSMGVDPTILLKVSEIAAYHIARHGLDFAKWSADAVSKFGDNVKPYLEQAWEDAQKLIQSQAKLRGGKKSSDVEKIVKKSDSTDTLNNAKERNAKGEKVDLHLLAHKLGKQFLSQGIKGRVAITDAVHNALKEIVPDITRDDAMDALSGYGKFKQLSKDEIDVELRDLKGQLQQEGKLRDMQAGHPPKMSGVEQRKKSDEERRLEKLVEEAKRRGGYVVTDPATQLKTTLDAIKTRLLNEISDFDYQIETRQKLIKNKRGVEYDAEAKALKEKRDERKKVYDEIFGKPELTGEQLAQRALSAVERSISEIERKIKENDLWTSKKQSKTPLTIELQAARSKRDALNEHLEYLRDLERPKKTPQERAAQADKTRKKHRIAELEDKLSRGDFSKNKPIEFTRDKEAIDLKYELERIKRRWNEGLFKDKLKNRTPAQKIADGIKETLLFQKAWKTAFDLSAIFRQGGFVAIGNPIRALKIMPDMFRAMKSEKEQFRIEEEIRSRPNALLYNEAKLFLSGHADTLTKMEEAYLGRWAEKVPLVSHSARAYTTFLNRLRADSFDAMVATLAKDGKPTLEEAKAIANFVNVATGRGSVGPTSNMGVTGMNLFFAPRYVVSRFQLLGGQPFYRGTARTRKAVAKEYAKFLIGLSVVYGIAKSAGATIEDDKRSPDFGKIKFGDNVIDPLSGLSQQASFIGRMATGEKKNTKTGQIQDLVNPKFGGPSIKTEVERYGRSKLSPAAALAYDALNRKGFDNKPLTLGGVAESVFVPINTKDVYEIMKDNNIPEGVALSIINTAGMGVSARKDN